MFPVSREDCKVTDKWLLLKQICDDKWTNLIPKDQNSFV